MSLFCINISDIDLFSKSTLLCFKGDSYIQIKINKLVMVIFIVFIMVIIYQENHDKKTWIIISHFVKWLWFVFPFHITS